MGKQSVTQHLLKAAAPYRAVAFDVFDTLIRRDCAQPGDLFALMEEKRPGQYFPVFEEDEGTYILNAKDMCMI